MTRTEKAEQLPWSAEQSIIIDHIGNEVYSSHYAERKLSRFIIVTLSVLLAVATLDIVRLASRPVRDRWVRIDELGRAQAIQYSDLSYSPREGEIRTYLTDWANYRYTINRETIAKKYPLNYYFLSAPLAVEYMGEDNQSHLLARVLNGQAEQSDVEVKSVTITSMSVESVKGEKFAKGTALVSIDKLYSPRYSREPRTEHWILSVTYYLNPQDVSERAKIHPQYETINPLGLVITEFHENRASVGPFTGGINEAIQGTTDAPTNPPAPIPNPLSLTGAKGITRR